MLNCQHMADFLDRGIHDEYPAEDENDGREIDPAFQNSGPVEHVERLGQGIDQLDHRKQQHHTKRDRDQDAPKAHRTLVRHRRPLAFD